MNQVDKKIMETGVVPVIKLENPERDARPLAEALCAGGVPAAEVTFRAAGAEEAIRRMKAARPDMLVGAGTVVSAYQVDLALEAGAQFIVSPGLDVDLVQYCQEKGVPVYPGCTTASEYQAALKLRLEVLKFFPAEQSGGLAKIKALAGPFPQFNLGDYLSCPVIAACGGSYMVTAELIGGQNWAEITRLCRQSREIVEAVRK